jgi:hypothetical protein
MEQRSGDTPQDDDRERLSMPGHESELVDQLEEEAAAESPRDESVPAKERDDAAGSAGVIDAESGAESDSEEPPD